MYQKLLDELRAVQARYGEQRQPSCTDDRIALLRRRVREEGTALLTISRSSRSTRFSRLIDRLGRP